MTGGWIVLNRINEPFKCIGEGLIIKKRHTHFWLFKKKLQMAAYTLSVHMGPKPSFLQEEEKQNEPYSISCCNGTSPGNSTRLFMRVPEDLQNMRVPYLNRYQQMYFNPLAYHSEF